MKIFLCLFALVFLSACNPASNADVPSPLVVTPTPHMETASSATPSISSGTIEVSGVGKITSTPAAGTSTSIVETGTPVTGIEITAPVTAADVAEMIDNPEAKPAMSIEDYTGLNSKYDKMVQANEAANLWPTVPDSAVPFTAMGMPTFDRNKSVWNGKDVGRYSAFVIPYKLIAEGTYFNNKGAAYPGVLADVQPVTIQGETAYGLLFRYKNPDETYGFYKYVAPKGNLPLAVTLAESGYQGNDVAVVADSITDNAGCAEYASLIGMNLKAMPNFCSWAVALPKKDPLDLAFYKDLKSGMWNNNRVGPDGKPVFYVPTAPLGGQATNSAQSIVTLDGYSN